MPDPPVVPSAKSAATSFQPSWTQQFAARLTGLTLARERQWLLAWDGQGTLHLMNGAGQRQGQTQRAGLSAACIADDGSALAAAGGNDAIWWLEPDLSVRWQRTLGGGCTALAMDSFGRYLAAAGRHGDICFWDRHGRTIWQVTSPRPLVHLTFVPTAPVLVGAGDFGLVLCLDMQGRQLWRDGLVVHVGSLAVNGDGSQILLACFGQGLVRYDRAGHRLADLSIADACRLVCVSFDGQKILVAGLDDRVYFLGSDGRRLGERAMRQPMTALALSPLADQALVALADGSLVALDMQTESPL